MPYSIAGEIRVIFSQLSDDVPEGPKGPVLAAGLLVMASGPQEGDGF